MTTELIELKTHKPLSASATERWWHCSGSVSLIPYAPSQPPSRYAAEGTYAHMLAELELKLRLGRQTDEDTRTWNLALSRYVVEGFTFSCDQEMQQAIHDYAEYILDLRDLYKLGNDYISTETKLDIPGNSSLGGTADCIIHVPYRRIIAIDFKYGAGIKVDVEENKQLMTYALGAYFSLDEGDRDEIDRVQIIVFQPRVRDGIQSWEISVSDLLAFHTELLDRARQTEVSQPTFEAGSWCKYCPAQLICKTHERFRTKETGIEFESVPVTPDYLQLSEEKIAQILNAKPMIEKWLEQVYSYANGLAIAGKTIPGYQLKEKLGNRKWIPGSLDTFILSQLNVHPDMLYKREFKSPAEIEKLAKQNKTKVDLSLWTTREVTGTTLAKVDTTLPALKMVDPFKEIESE